MTERLITFDEDAVDEMLDEQSRRYGCAIHGNWAPGCVHCDIVWKRDGAEPRRIPEAEYECASCEDCGYVANDEDRSPWRRWQELPPKSWAAVFTGIIRPEPCPDCSGRIHRCLGCGEESFCAAHQGGAECPVREVVCASCCDASGIDVAAENAVEQYKRVGFVKHKVRTL